MNSFDNVKIRRSYDRREYCIYADYFGAQRDIGYILRMGSEYKAVPLGVRFLPAGTFGRFTQALDHVLRSL